MTVHALFPGPVSRGPHAGLPAACRSALRRVRSAYVEHVSFTAETRAYRTLLRSITRDRRTTVTLRPTADEVARATADTPARTVLAAELAPGRSAPQALLACVRALVGQGSLRQARALVAGALRVAELSEVAHAGGAVLAVARGRLTEAENHLRGVSRPAALELVPAELVAVEFALDPALAVRTCQVLLADPATRQQPGTWNAVSRTCRAHGEQDLARQAWHAAGHPPAQPPTWEAAAS